AAKVGRQLVHAAVEELENGTELAAIAAAMPTWADVALGDDLDTRELVERMLASLVAEAAGPGIERRRVELEATRRRAKADWRAGARQDPHRRRDGSRRADPRRERAAHRRRPQRGRRHGRPLSRVRGRRRRARRSPEIPARCPR